MRQVNHLWLVFLGMACPGAGAEGAAPPASSLPARPQRETSGGPYCGIYSAYAALKLLGIDPRFADLLEKKYVGSFRGSSAVELKMAVDDQGCHAEVMEGLTSSSLRGSPHPIILHVRRPGLNTPYAHWVLFLGVEGDKARIVDPPHGVQLLPFPELLSLWDGVGVVVMRAPSDSLPLRAAAWVEMAVCLLLVITLLGVARFAQRPRPGGSFSGRWLPPSGALFLLSVALAVAYHLAHEDGFLHNRVAVAQVVGRHFEPAFASIEAEEVEGLVGRPGVCIVDARSPEAYSHGHLPGAVSLPVYSGLVERAETLAAVRPTDRVVLYCQSEWCPWARVVAADLVYRGYKDVVLFGRGYDGWVEHKQSKRPD